MIALAYFLINFLSHERFSIKSLVFGSTLPILSERLLKFSKEFLLLVLKAASLVANSSASACLSFPSDLFSSLLSGLSDFSSHCFDLSVSGSFGLSADFSELASFSGSSLMVRREFVSAKLAVDYKFVILLMLDVIFFILATASLKDLSCFA